VAVDRSSSVPPEGRLCQSTHLHAIPTTRDMHSPLPGPVAGFLRFSEKFGKYLAWRRFPTSTGPQIYKKLERARAPRLVRRGSFLRNAPMTGMQHLGPCGKNAPTRAGKPHQLDAGPPSSGNTACAEKAHQPAGEKRTNPCEKGARAEKVHDLVRKKRTNSCFSCGKSARM